VSHHTLNCIASSKTLPVSGGKARIFSGNLEVGDVVQEKNEKKYSNKSGDLFLIPSNIGNFYRPSTSQELRG
jgi:hypothetical protein